MVLRVGPEEDEKQFRVPKNLLMAHSAYFEKALAGDKFKEGATNEVVLRDIKCRPFAVLLTWIYSGSLRSMVTVHKGEDEGGDRPYCALFTDTYVLAERFVVPDCKKALLKFAADWFNTNRCAPSYEAVNSAFDNLPDTDNYLRLIIDTFCKYAKEITADDFVDLSPEFLFLAVRVMHKYSRAELQFLDTSVERYDPANELAGDLQDQEELIRSAWN